MSRLGTVNSRRMFGTVALVLVPLVAACGSSSKNNATATTVAPTTSSSVVSTVNTVASSLGNILVDARGMTLYTFDKDSPNTSACTGACATTWPPLAAPSSGSPVGGTGVTGLTTITRADGTQQVAINGKPLYNYSGDTKPGDTKGDGFAGKWHVVKATGSTSGSPAPSNGGYGY
jgi:predicted lipoprotein with Yx(FWY)xxD motif